MRKVDSGSKKIQRQENVGQTINLDQTGIDVQTFLDFFPLYVMLIDAGHRILFANKATRRDLHVDPEQILGGYCPKVVHGVDEPYPGCPLEEAIEKGHAVEKEFLNPETGRWVSSAIYPTERRTREGAEIFLHLISDITKRKEAEEELRKNYDIQTVINTILSLSLEEIPLQELLDRILGLILSIPWLTLEAKGSIYVVEDEPQILVMKSQRGLPLAIQKKCARIPHGKCLCGKAASTQEIQVKSHIDANHEITHEGMTPHGHYCVPILFGTRILGVINLYLQEGHQPNQKEVEFLTSVANSLAGIIARRQIDEALQKREKELEIKTSNLEEMNSALKVLLKRREEDRKELEEHVFFNVKELVVQYLEKLRNTPLDKKQSGYMDILESNLNNIISPFSRTLSHQYFDLTPVEIQIADLTRQGKSTKEMAEFFNVSPRTIEFHRQNIRKKLGLQGKKANLRTRLLSLK